MHLLNHSSNVCSHWCAKLCDRAYCRDVHISQRAKVRKTCVGIQDTWCIHPSGIWQEMQSRWKDCGERTPAHTQRYGQAGGTTGEMVGNPATCHRGQYHHPRAKGMTEDRWELEPLMRAQSWWWVRATTGDGMSKQGAPGGMPQPLSLPAPPSSNARVPPNGQTQAEANRGGRCD